VNISVNPSIGQTWVLASIGAVVEMGVLSRTLKRLLMESNLQQAGPQIHLIERPDNVSSNLTPLPNFKV
jgi:hypothetical protein